MRTRKRRVETEDDDGPMVRRRLSGSVVQDALQTAARRTSPRIARVSLSPTVLPAVADSSSDEGDKECPLDLLPDDVLAKFLFGGYVNSLGIIARVSCVSKRTRRVAQETVKLLDLRNCKSMKPRNVGNIVSRFQNLSEIDFNYCPQFTGRHLQKLVPLSKTLKTLKLRGSSVTDGDIVGYLSRVQKLLEGPSLLKELDVSAITKSGSTRIGDSAVVKISLSCPDLEWLHLGWCTRVTDEAVKSLERLRYLRELDLSLCGVTANSCQVLSKLSYLKTLDLSATQVGNDGIRMLMGAEYAEGESDDDTNTSLLRLNEANNGYRSPLEKLSTRFNTDLSVETLQLVAARAPKLKTLDLCYCDELDKESTRAVYRDLKENGTTIIDENGQSNPAEPQT